MAVDPALDRGGGAPADACAATNMLIVNYHAIAAERSRISCTPQDLTADLRGLRDAGFSFVTLDDCADWLAGHRSLSDPSVAITFDDGYASVASAAMPILAAEQVPCTVFVVVGRLGRDNQWPGQLTSVPRLLLIDRGALAEMVTAGINIGAHTYTHPRLPHLGPADARREIVEAGKALEDLVGCPVRHFAYPYGLRARRDMELARDRYVLALNAIPAAVDRPTVPWDVPRLDCHDIRVALRLRLTGDRYLSRYLAVRRVLRRGRGR